MRAKSLIVPAAAALAAAAGVLSAAAPAAAQPYYYTGTYYAPSVDELVVTGPMRRDGPQSLSRAVSYRDLDLTTWGGREILKERIRFTARDLCRLLGERNRSPLLGGRTCEADAIRNTRTQVRVAVNRAYATRAYASLDD